MWHDRARARTNIGLVHHQTRLGATAGRALFPWWRRLHPRDRGLVVRAGSCAAQKPSRPSQMDAGLATIWEEDGMWCEPTGLPSPVSHFLRETR